ncbi:transposase family protein [Pseudonocardia nigra]|uniref:transposase family protein n=1 Tax=Pseudonocardia nigra TaxID=1921578 RepID=UPI003555CCC6
MIETTADVVGCPECGAVARAKDRRATSVGDLPIGGRPVVLCWVKRVWACPARTGAARAGRGPSAMMRSRRGRCSPIGPLSRRPLRSGRARQSPSRRACSGCPGTS